MNLADLRAIDVHTHVWKSARTGSDARTETQEVLTSYFRSRPQHTTLPEMVDYYRRLKMAFVVFAVDGEPGQRAEITNEEIAEIAGQHPDCVIPFASVNPHRGEEGVRWARRLIQHHGIRGFKFHPSVQRF